MCNWAVLVGNTRKDNVDRLLLTLASTANTDATGAAVIRAGQTQRPLLKAPIKAERFIGWRNWRKWYKTNAKPKHDRPMENGALFLHARNATNGMPHYNPNNHPHYTEAGSILIHKGVFRGWDESKFGEHCRSDCDSERMLVALDTLGLNKALKEFEGSCELAYAPHYDSHAIYFYSSTTGIAHFPDKWGGLVFVTLTGTKSEDVAAKQWMRLDLETKRLEPIGDKQSLGKAVTPIYHQPNNYINNRPTMICQVQSCNRELYTENARKTGICYTCETDGLTLDMEFCRFCGGPIMENPKKTGVVTSGYAEVCLECYGEIWAFIANMRGSLSAKDFNDLIEELFTYSPSDDDDDDDGDDNKPPTNNGSSVSKPIESSTAKGEIYVAKEGGVLTRIVNGVVSKL